MKLRIIQFLLSILIQICSFIKTICEIIFHEQELNIIICFYVFKGSTIFFSYFRVDTVQAISMIQSALTAVRTPTLELITELITLVKTNLKPMGTVHILRNHFDQKCPWYAQKFPYVSTSVLKCPQLSTNVRKCPRGVRKCLEISENTQKCQNVF